MLIAALAAMREAGYTEKDVQDLVTAVLEHFEGDGYQPYAFCHCTNC